MLLLRNILFAACFYTNCVFWFVFAFIGYLMPQRHFIRFCRGWASSSTWLFETLIGAPVIVRGADKLPAGGYIVAAKHQSALETFTLIPWFDFPTFVYKKELDYIPLFGQHLRRARQIPIERTGQAETLRRLNNRAKAALAEGRQIIIFPEGTRRAVGAEPDYKIGVAQMYRSIGAPVVPVALNSGVAWPRRRFLKYPCPVIIEFLDPIPAGMPAKQFFAQLQEKIETATDRLVAEAVAGSTHSRSEIQSSSVS